MSYFSLTESLLEMSYGDVIKKQKAVVKLFPSQKDRERQVGKNGGAKLIRTGKDLFTFEVQSGDTTRHAAGVTYLTNVYFGGVDSVLQQAAKDKKNWTMDGKNLNLNALGRAVLYGADLKMSCNCPASQYWGFNYIKTQSDSEYNYPEDRSPNVRNPNQYGITCKHFGLILSVLPFYAVTIGTLLKTYYKNEIINLQKEVLHSEYNPEKAEPQKFAQEEQSETEVEPEENPDEGGL